MEHLLFTGDYNKSEAEIKEKGGRITHRLSDQVFVAHLQASSCSCILKHSSSQPLSEPDEKSSMMIKAWKKLHAEEEQTPSGWTPAKAEHMKQLPAANLQKRQAPLPVMTGHLAIGIVVVSGTTEEWQMTEEESTDAITKVMKACRFLAAAGGSMANLSFSYDIYTAYINSIPNPNCTSFESCEAVFRDPALLQIGYSFGQAGVIALSTDIAKRNNAALGFVSFITKYPMFKPYYGDGPKFCLNYPEAIATITQQFVYLLAQFFGAAYEGDGCSCANSGYYNVPNLNCANCNGYSSKLPCVMNDLSLALCPWTMAQIGWFNPLVAGDPTVIIEPDFVSPDDIKMAMVYRETSNMIGLFQWSLDKNGMPSNQQYQNLGLSAGLPPATGDPSIVAFNNGFHIVYRDNNDEIADVSSPTGSGWHYQNLNNVASGAPKAAGDPVIGLYKGNPYVFYGDINNEIAVIAWNGTNWLYTNVSKLTKATPLGIGTKLNYQYFNDAIHLVYLDADNNICDIINNEIFINVSSALWSVPKPKTKSDLSVVYENLEANHQLLHIVYRDINDQIAEIVCTWQLMWVYQNISKSIPGSPLAGGNPAITNFYWDGQHHGFHLLFPTADNKLADFCWMGSWRYTDVSKLLPGTTPAIAPGVKLSLIAHKQQYILVPSYVYIIYYNAKDGLTQIALESKSSNSAFYTDFPFLTVQSCID